MLVSSLQMVEEQQGLMKHERNVFVHMELTIIPLINAPRERDENNDMEHYLEVELSFPPDRWNENPSPLKTAGESTSKSHSWFIHCSHM